MPFFFRSVRLPFGLLVVLVLVVSGLLAGSAYATESAEEGPSQYQFEGRLGDTRIGMTIVLREGVIRGGHYFYQRYLKDIPITGSREGASVTLQEPGGGIFDLHFVGFGSASKQPLDFENSKGLDGVWRSADGGRSYPVTLRTIYLSHPAEGPRYAAVTRESDAVFESRVQALLHAVLHGDKTGVTDAISYPLTVHFGPDRSEQLRSPAEVLAAWNDLFAPVLTASWRSFVPHDMGVRDGMAELGSGALSFDAKGLAGLYVPPPSMTRHWETVEQFQRRTGQSAPPSESCTWDEDSRFTLEEARGPQTATLYDVCRLETVCNAVPAVFMEPGHPIEVYRTQGEWSCGYYASPRWGGGPAWVRTADLQWVASSPHPALEAWVGDWVGTTNRVRIRRAAVAGALTLKGTAYWEGMKGVVHTGDIAGEATPEGAHLHFVEDPKAESSCVVDLNLYDAYIVAADNNRCGALNVRFGGIWRRASVARSSTP